MEKLYSIEQAPSIDFLDENLEVSFELTPDTLNNLPSISAEDEKTGIERYGVLLGSISVNSEKSVHVKIKGVYRETEEDIYGSYEEGVEEVSYDLILIKNRMGQIQRDNLEYIDYGFLGDVHTHPISNIAKPSLEDLTSVIRAYESGDLKPTEPFIFGIGARNPDGEMEYWFYRIIKTDSQSGYGYKALD